MSKQTSESRQRLGPGTRFNAIWVRSETSTDRELLLLLPLLLGPQGWREGLLPSLLHRTSC